MGEKNIAIVPYCGLCEKQTLHRIKDFFDFHGALVQGKNSEAEYESDAILKQWTTEPNVLYIITVNGADTGFVRICFRGPTVAWIEDIFVDAHRRGKGIATSAVKEAEKIITATRPDCEAVCLDVVLRNTDALRLYHKLGYSDISLVTVRKEFGESKRDKPVNILGLDFKY